jgi:FkbM family methyltransferase
MPARPLLWQFLTPAMFAVVPRLRDRMRTGRPSGWKRWLFRCFLDPYTNLRDDRLEVTAFFGARFEGTLGGLIVRSVFHFGVYEPNLTAWLMDRLRPGDVFADVGANVGYFSLLGAALVGESGGVVALEPAPSTFRALQENIARNGAGNVRAVNAAAYDREGTLPIFTVSSEEHAGGASIVREMGPREADVVARPLAAILRHDEIARMRLIKIDVEGAEVAAVRGLMPALGRAPQSVEVVVELSAATERDVRVMLEPLGFQAYVLANPSTPLEANPSASARPVRLAHGAAAAAGESVAYVVFSREDKPAL